MSSQPEVIMAERLEAPEEMNPALAALVERIIDPPVLSTVGIKLIYELRQEETSVRKLSEIVQSEPALAAKVLRHANSSFYGIRNRIQSIHHAITMLGLESIKEVACNLYFYSFSEQYSRSLTEFTEKYLKRCVTTAMLAKKISQHYRFSNVGGGEAYLAGLLADIGVFLLYQTERAKYEEALALSEEIQIPVFMAEERVFGFNHSELGSWLARKWNLPASIEEVTRSHHRIPEDAVSLELLTTIQLAEWICDRMGVVLGYAEPQGALDPKAAKILMAQCPDESLDEILSHSLSTFGSVCMAAGEITRVMREEPDPVKEQLAESTPQAAPDTLTSSKAAAATPGRRWLPWLAGLIVCGLGQVVEGNVGKGFGYLILFTIFLTLFLTLPYPVSTGPGFAALAVWGLSLIDLWDRPEKRLGAS